MFVVEINPGCVNITCHNGGRCLYVNDTHDAVCICLDGFRGLFCEGKKSKISINYNFSLSLGTWESHFELDFIYRSNYV